MQGGIFSRRLFLASIGAAMARPSMATEPVDLELVLAADVSGSMSADELALQRQGYVEALAHPETVRAIERGFIGRIAVTYFEWSNTGSRFRLLDWSIIEDSASASRAATILAEAPILGGGHTSISGAIDFARELFSESPASGARRVLDISGDGTNNQGRRAAAARADALADGVVINGLPVISHARVRAAESLVAHYRDDVVGGPGSFVLPAAAPEDWHKAIRQKLILEIT